MITPVEVGREDVPPIARAAAAQAIADLPAFSTPEEMADAALDAVWPLAREDRAITPFEIEVVRRLLVDYGRTRPEAAELMGCKLDRITSVARRGGVRTGLAGRHGANRWNPDMTGLAELVADARKALNYG